MTQPPEIPTDRRYTTEHEWARLEGEGQALVGITDYAQKLLGDVVFLSLPSVGDDVAQFAKCGEIESPKAVSDIFTPLSGEVSAINEGAMQHPESVNREPYGQGWLFRLSLSQPTEWDQLLTAEAYRKLVGGREG